MGCQDEGITVSADILREGDIVFRRGQGVRSRAVVEMDRYGMYSHVGIVVSSDSGLMIIHAVPDEAVKGQPDYIKMDRPDEFFSEKRSCRGCILRISDPDSIEVAEISARYALKKYTERIKFDHDYNLGDTTAMYCTELVWLAYLHSGIDITAGHRSEISNLPIFSGTYILPSDIFGSGILKEVIHFSTFINP